MQLGGNRQAADFFRQHGWQPNASSKIPAKYNSRVALLYKQQLAAKVNAALSGQTANSNIVSDTSQHESQPDTSNQATDDDYWNQFFSESTTTPAKPSTPSKETTHRTPSASPAPVATLSQPTLTPSRAASRASPGVGGASLAQKKLATSVKKVSADAFADFDSWDPEKEQKEAEQRQAEQKQAEQQQQQSSLSSFSNSQLTANKFNTGETQSQPQPQKKQQKRAPRLHSHSLFAFEPDSDQGDSPHNADDDDGSMDSMSFENFRKNMPSIHTLQTHSETTHNQRNNAAAAANVVGSGDYERFKNAKSISSDQYFGRDKKEADPVTQAKLSEFHTSNAKAISSDQLFGTNTHQSGDYGESDFFTEFDGDDLASQIANTAAQDFEQLKSAATVGAQVLSEAVSDFFSDW
eukprot:CAMPEP_0201549778 /NCGR_PEP_ID=MMETSP0173_2-20130828/6226_1 /ASSEMBLY_ACC=CAM_ASM_000268 /TAXON_ID=218659 /ORGANISM="Vexillifera sp., Strain DIVA3 564/2" /LENGTH=407 /DNA_ID=CAMNT_0047959575 /DNA_START=215 /DNA_END=1435 /DNA_ORIENTATION=+